MAETVVRNPTYMEHIRHFFEEIDHVHMWEKGIDLSTYDAVVRRATDIYFQTLPPNANMPPEPNRKWSKQRSDTYKNWVANRHPFGTPKPAPLKKANVARLRKDVDSLKPDEIAVLKAAFEGMMARGPDDPESYFAIAGLHWFPAPSWCEHHVDKYNPWHRAYLEKFEDAMRSVPGCESVTLPYWDITKTPPPFLFQKPFADYTLPRDIHPRYRAGYTTRRYRRGDIARNVRAADIPGIIDDAMKQPVWADFVTFTGRGIEAAHDAGHGAVGQTLTNPDAASFDPIFWFFHANWDRLWWEWQQKMRATTLWTFRSTIRGSTVFLEPPFDDLKPFTRKAGETIDSHAMGIGYEIQPQAPAAALERPRFGSMMAASGVAVGPASTISVRLKGVDRLKIPGSFRADLKANGKKVGQRVFFQSTEPLDCDTCREKAIIDLDFRLPANKVAGKKLEVEIHVLTPRPGLDSRFPLHSCGNPSLNARMLLEEA